MLRKTILTIICIFCLAGCSLADRNKEEENPDSEVINTVDLNDVQGEDTSTIVIWGLFEEEEIIQPLIDSFEVQNPDYQINYIKKAKADYPAELKNALEDPNPNVKPDIFMIHNSWVGNYESYILNAPAATFSVEDFNEEFHAFVAEDFAAGGVVRGVPLWVDLTGLVYNNRHLVEAGSTVIPHDWNEFQLVAKNMTRITDDIVTRAGFSAGTTENIDSYFDLMNLLFMQTREFPLEGDEANRPFEESNIEAARDAVAFYKSFLNEPLKTWDRTLKLDVALFIEGKLSSMVTPTWRLLDIIRYNDGFGLNLDLNTAQVPQLNPTENQEVYFPTYWGLVVSSASDKSSASWQFLRYITEAEAQQDYINAQLEADRPFPMISPRKDLLDSYSQYSLLTPYINSIPNTHSWYMVNGEKLKPTYGEVINGSEDVEQILVKVSELQENKEEL